MIPTDLGLFEKAFRFAESKHKDQMCDEGNPYFWHCEQVVKIMIQITNDEEILCAAILHDTIEDTDTTYEELLENFGKRVADIVMEVTHDGQKDSKGFYFPRLKSRDAILIKFADRLSNLSRMKSWSKERQEHYLKKSKFWRDS